MTEQEALNSPEMKTIMLLSGYVRELKEGKDYEETTYKLAETIAELFSMSHVSQKRELLAAYHKFLDWEKKDDEGEIINNVNAFLGNL